MSLKKTKSMKCAVFHMKGTPPCNFKIFEFKHQSIGRYTKQNKEVGIICKLGNIISRPVL